MEIAIGIGIAFVIAGLFKGRKSRKPQPTHIETAEERKLREADEIVTVILPTIHHDK